MALSIAPAPRRSTVRVAALVAAALPDLGSPLVALELARNASCSLLVDEADGIETDPATVIREAIEHRMTHFGLVVIDVDRCVEAMARAWVSSGEWLR